MCKITKSILLSLFVTLFAQFPISGMYYRINQNINPNADGCIKNVETGKYCQHKTLEATFKFEKNNRKITNPYFSNQDKNAYKVRVLPCLRQPISGPCGFYSVFHLVQLLKGQSLLSRQALNNLYRGNSAYQRSINYGESSRSNEMQKVAMKHFTNKNFIIAKNGREANQKTLIRYDGYGREIGRETSDGFLDRVKEFQRNGTTQYLVISCEKNATIPGIRLDWDNKNDRLNSLHNHWIAIKIEWVNKQKPGKCPVIISVAESGSPKDLRYARIIHWYYHKFVHAYNFYINRSKFPAASSYRSRNFSNASSSTSKFPATSSYRSRNFSNISSSTSNFPAVRSYRKSNFPKVRNSTSSFPATHSYRRRNFTVYNKI